MEDFRAIQASFGGFSAEILYLNATVALAQCLSRHAERENDVAALRKAIAQYEILRQITDTLEASKAALTKLNHAQALRRLGEAIMSTLAIACAKSAGLKIITDGRRLHECLARLDGQHVYEAWVKGDDALREPRALSGHELLECLVTIACDTTELTPQILAEMKDEREPLRKLLAALDAQAKEIAPMDDGAERKKKMRDEVAKILAAWEADSRNLSPFFKRFFGLGLLDPGAKFADKVATGLSNAATSGSAGATASLMLSAEYGVAIGFFTHAVKSFADTRAGKQNSPYTLLTNLQREGVVFRSSADVKRWVDEPDPDDQRDIANYDDAF